MIDRQSSNVDNINKLIANQLARKAGYAVLAGVKGIFGALVPLIIVYIVPVIAVFLIFMLAYTGIFLLPRAILEESIQSGDRTIAVFSWGDENSDDMWTEEQDQELYGIYTELANSWKDGLDAFQQQQAEEYALSWGVLAGVDRTVGDPSVNYHKVVYPDPEKHYDILQPFFDWKDSSITTVTETTWYEEPDEDGEGGGWFSSTSTNVEHLKLLVTADTFEANYDYDYEWETTVSSSTWATGSTTTTVTQEKLIDITESGPYYERMILLLTEYDLDNMLELNLEFVLELATVYDENYKFNIENRWLGVNSLALDFSDSYYSGTLGTFIWPLPRQYTYISSPFGNRIHPIRGGRQFHTGVDVPAPRRTPVYAMTDGYVRFASNLGGYGRTVLIEHGNNVVTLYAHLYKIDVKVGDIVSMGDIIGRVGSTGASTGDHLHFEIRKIVNGDIKYTNPMNQFTAQ